MSGRIAEKVGAVVCALCLAGGVMSGIVFAKAEEAPAVQETEEARETFFVTSSPWEGVDSPADAEPMPAVQVTTQPLAVQSPDVVDNRNVIPCQINDTLWGDCPVEDGMPWIGVEDLCRALGLNVYSESGDGVFTLSGDISFRAAAGDIYFVFNDRYILLETGVRMRGGQALLPVELISRCLGISARWDPVEWKVYIRAESVTPLESGSSFYEDTDVYWMSRVIYAEAGNQPLLGQVAVGSVVMNRMASDELFTDQNSVYDVIFAKNQFEVVVNGMIYMEPGENACIAAKLALEGYDVADGALFFDGHEWGDGYETVMWIGDHCFMRQA